MKFLATPLGVRKCEHKDVFFSTKIIANWHVELCLSDPRVNEWICLFYYHLPRNVRYSQGRSDGGGYIGIYTPKSVYLNFLCGCFVSLTHLYPPKSNFWLRLWLFLLLAFYVIIQLLAATLSKDLFIHSFIQMCTFNFKTRLVTKFHLDPLSRH